MLSSVTLRVGVAAQSFEVSMMLKVVVPRLRMFELTLGCCPPVSSARLSVVVDVAICLL